MSSAGFTLTEVMISLLLLSIIFIGLSAIQVTAMRETRAASYLVEAEEQWINFSERMRALSGLRGFATQVRQWKTETAIVLPNSHANVTGKKPSVHIVINWGNTKTSCPEMIKTGLSGCIRKEAEFF